MLQDIAVLTGAALSAPSVERTHPGARSGTEEGRPGTHSHGYERGAMKAHVVVAV